MLTTDEKWRFCSIVQLTRSVSRSCETEIPEDYLGGHIPIPSVPNESSYVKTMLMSADVFPVDFSGLKNIRFSLPAGLDNAILHGFSSSWDYSGSFYIDNLVSVWGFH